MEMSQLSSNTIIKILQNKPFQNEVQKTRQKEGSLRKESLLSTLNQLMDKHGIIRVGARIRRSELIDGH